METENKAEKNLTTEMVDSYNKNLNIGIKLFNSCFNIKTITDATHKQMEVNLDIQQNTLDGISNFINSLTKQSKATLNNMESLAGHQYQNNLTNLNESKNGEVKKTINPEVTISKKI